MKADTNGRVYAHISNTKAGDTIQVDSGFTCIKPHTTVTIEVDDKDFYFQCDEGRHYLGGQLDDETGAYIGLYHV